MRQVIQNEKCAIFFQLFFGLDMTNTTAEISINDADEHHFFSSSEGRVYSALKNSSRWIAAYEDSHLCVRGEARGKLAMARLQWVLEEGRSSLDRQFTSDEFAVICSAFNGEITSPQDMDGIAMAVVEEYGIDIDDDIDNYKNYPVAAKLIDKLRQLSPIECLALLDLVEIFWHYPRSKLSSLEDFMLCFGVSAAKETE